MFCSGRSAQPQTAPAQQQAPGPVTTTPASNTNLLAAQSVLPQQTQAANANYPRETFYFRLSQFTTCPTLKVVYGPGYLFAKHVWRLTVYPKGETQNFLVP